ncbi:hypothetical protein BDV09DRAFT_171581 [Aspergillus tetrazonus]
MLRVFSTPKPVMLILSVFLLASKPFHLVSSRADSRKPDQTVLVSVGSWLPAPPGRFASTDLSNNDDLQSVPPSLSGLVGRRHPSAG